MKFSVESLNLDKNRNNIYIAFFILFILLDLLIILRLQIKGTGAAIKKIKKVKSELSAGRKDVASFYDLSARYENLKKAKELEAKQFIHEDEALALLGSLSNLAQDNNVVISQINPQKGAMPKEINSPMGKFYILQVIVNAQAGYHNLGKFLNQIENDPRFMKIITLDINQDSRDYLHHFIRLKIGVLVAKK